MFGESTPHMLLRMVLMSPLGFLIKFAIVWGASSIIGLVLHELSHAAVGWLVGKQIKEIRIGDGPTLFQLRFGETLFCVRRWPKQGTVFPYPSRHERKFASILFIMAGPAMEFLLFALACYVFYLSTTSIDGSEWTQWIALVAINRLASVLSNTVVPRDLRRDGKPVPNDLKRLFEIIKQGPPSSRAFWEHYTQSLAGYWDGKGPSPQPSRQSERIAHRLYAKPDNVMAVPDQADLDALDREIRRGPPPAETLYILESLTWRALAASRDDLVPRMDAWTRQAVSILPRLRTSRGVVLGMLGRHDEALKMLEGADDWPALFNNILIAQVLFHKGEQAAAINRFETSLEREGSQMDEFTPYMSQLVERIAIEIGATITLSAVGHVQAEGPSGEESVKDCEPADGEPVS